VLVAIALLIAAPSCTGHKPPSTLDTSGLDEKLSTFVFMEEGKLVSLIVDAKAARIHEKSLYFPLEICVANRGLASDLILTRESFTLIDQDGNRYDVASPRDLIESYQYLDIDRQQAELQSIVDSRFVNFTRYPATFSPTRLPGPQGVVQDRVSLPKWGYMVDFIYFPVPQSGLVDRRFELHMEATELPDPVFVKFAVQ
jgi:hypothetical protein